MIRAQRLRREGSHGSHPLGQLRSRHPQSTRVWLESRRTKNFSPENTGLQRNTLEGFSSILDTVGALANQRQKLRASFFLIVEYALDGETGGAATEPQILQRNEAEISISRAAH